jgi:hypothetical protein
MRKVLIIGAGGIGSFLIQNLDKVGMYDITVADPDKVEQKNLTYQNFTKGHVGQNKALVMRDSYESVKHANTFPILSEKQMQGYDLVMCCVDNLGVRRTLYNTSIKWLDLRAQGRNAAFISSYSDPMLYDSLLAGDDRSYSCQGDSWDGTNKNVQFMQIAIAGLGAQWAQKFFNEEEVKDFIMINI